MKTIINSIETHATHFIRTNSTNTDTNGINNISFVIKKPNTTKKS